MANGFTIIRRGLLDHLESGSLSLPDLGVYLILHLQCDFRTGIWIGSAEKIRVACPRSTTIRAIQKSISRLRKIGFVKTFSTRGKRGNYPLILDKYVVQSGALTGRRLNASLTTDWRRPVYEAGADRDAERAVTRTQSGRLSNKNKKEEEGNLIPEADGPSFYFEGKNLKITASRDALVARSFPDVSSVQRMREYAQIDLWLEDGRNGKGEIRRLSSFLANWFRKAEADRAAAAKESGVGKTSEGDISPVTARKVRIRQIERGIRNLEEIYRGKSGPDAEKAKALIERDREELGILLAESESEREARK